MRERKSHRLAMLAAFAGGVSAVLPASLAMAQSAAPDLAQHEHEQPDDEQRADADQTDPAP